MFLRRPTDKQLIARSGLFDSGFYTATYPDIAAAKVDPLEHYLHHGRKEHRKPCVGFDPLAYLDANPDLDLYSTDPLLHYIQEGKKQGRPLVTRLPPLRPAPIGKLPGMALTAAQNESLANDYQKLQAFIQTSHFLREWQLIQDCEPGIISERWHKVFIPPASDPRYFVHREIRRRLSRTHYDTILFLPSVAALETLSQLKPGESILQITQAPSAQSGLSDSLDLSDLLPLLSEDQWSEVISVLLLGLTPRRVINLDHGPFSKTHQLYSRPLSQYTRLYTAADDSFPDLLKSEIPLRHPGESDSVKPPTNSAFTITAILTLHREGTLCAPTLVNFAQAIEFARKAGLSVEAFIACDRPDSMTESMARELKNCRVEILDVGDPAHARNAAAALATGQYVAFLDGDDFWCEDWLVACHRYQAQLDHPTILHPAFNVYLGKLPAVMVHVDSASPAFDPDSQRLANNWTSLCFAPREIWSAHKYPPSDLKLGFGHEDWSWNSQTLAAGIFHRPCPETFHVIRQRLASVSADRDAHRVIPRPTALTSYAHSP